MTIPNLTPATGGTSPDLSYAPPPSYEMSVVPQFSTPGYDAGLAMSNPTAQPSYTASQPSYSSNYATTTTTGNYSNVAAPSTSMERGGEETNHQAFMESVQKTINSGVGGGTGEAFKVCVDLNKMQEVRDFKNAMPHLFKSRNVTNGDHYSVVQGLEDCQQANPFINCASCECMYWCCPLGPVQMCLCFLNPCTYCIYAEMDGKKKAFNKDIRSLMAKYNIKAEIRDDGLETFAYFDPL